MSKRKSFGNTWWGKKWLDALKNIDYSNRLPRGRRYANNGSVASISLKGNHIQAKVRGTRPRPYTVDLHIPTFNGSEKAKIIDLIVSNPLFLSQLLNRKLPSDLHELCKRQGIHIFPSSWGDLKGRCSCPDWAVPCKHMAAVLYLVANEIDKNPFVVFDLHEFDLFKGLAGIGYTLQGQEEIQIIHVEQLRRSGVAASEPLEFDLSLYDQLDFTQIPDSRISLLTLLSENPVFYPEGNFKGLLERVYKQVSKTISRKKAPASEEKTNVILDQIDEIELLLNGELAVLNCNFRDSKGKSIEDFQDISELIEWLEMTPLSTLEFSAPAFQGLYWSYRFASRLAVQAAYIPQLLQIGSKFFRTRWIPALLIPEVRQTYELLLQLVPRDIVYYKDTKHIYVIESDDALISLLSVFLNYFVQAYQTQIDSYSRDDIGNLFFKGETLKFDKFENREYPSAIQLWINKFYISDQDYVPVFIVDDADGVFEVSMAVEAKADPLAQLISISKLLKEQQYVGIRMKVLRNIAMLAEYFPQISGLIATGGKEKLFFDSREFVGILLNILPIIELFGIRLLLPKALRKLLRPQLSVAIEADEDGQVAFSSLISLENMLRFKWQVAIGDQLVSHKQFAEMVMKFAGIVKINDQYVHFDPKEIKSLLDKLENPPVLKGHDLLQIALMEEYEGAPIQLNAEARKLMDRLMGAEGTEVPLNLKATLRPYQLRGYEWLYKNARMGFGSLLADDMGLGKTLQVISTLLKFKEENQLNKQKALIIVPTTLLTNWQKEIQKFAPSLLSHIYHGQSRSLEKLREVDILLTTYGILRSDINLLNKQKWLVVVIDEAQNIKNPSTIQTKAVKKVKAGVKIALSGTPVENRMSEYWSIFDFANKGYLKTLKKFKDEFAIPIEVDRDQKQLKRFKRITQPFILRRLKSDKSIIADLPDKIEKDQFCTLTSEQAAIYQNIIDTTMKSVESSDGIDRRGQIFKLITALKQICNHPKHFLKKGPEDPTRSGKSEYLLKLLEAIFEQGEKTLIFTQYQEMGNLLVSMFKNHFEIETPFLHGGLSRKQRDEMVEDFQQNRSTRVMILSLKAGGTGLNLTAASNVIHYDLWWNPAVEAQATDRAYRIGQERNVMVHRFITQGTFEEKINQLLLKKKELADLTVSTGEKWIGELSNQELRELVTLNN